MSEKPKFQTQIEQAGIVGTIAGITAYGLWKMMGKSDDDAAKAGVAAAGLAGVGIFARDIAKDLTEDDQSKMKHT